MSITFSKDAAKAVVIAMENVGLDSTKFALQLDVTDEGNISMAFIAMEDNRFMRFQNQHGLYLQLSRDLPNGVIIDYGIVEGRYGLIFVKERK